MWTIRWPEVAGTNGPLELTPRNLTFKTENRKYDYCKAKFSTEIGEMLKPETGSETGQLRDPQPVELLLDNERIAALYFKPDSVRYTDGGTHIEFYDLQESMDSGVVDEQWNEVKLRDIYEYVFDKRDNDLIKTSNSLSPMNHRVGRSSKPGQRLGATVLTDCSVPSGSKPMKLKS